MLRTSLVSQKQPLRTGNPRRMIWSLSLPINLCTHTAISQSPCRLPPVNPRHIIHSAALLGDHDEARQAANIIHPPPSGARNLAPETRAERCEKSRNLAPETSCKTQRMLSARVPLVGVEPYPFELRLTFTRTPLRRGFLCCSHPRTFRPQSKESPARGGAKGVQLR
jgi:hypothetical protein